MRSVVGRICLVTGRGCYGRVTTVSGLAVVGVLPLEGVFSLTRIREIVVYPFKERLRGVYTAIGLLSTDCLDMQTEVYWPITVTVGSHLAYLAIMSFGSFV